MSDLFTNNPKDKENLRRSAVEETKSAQRLLHAQEEARKRQHLQILEMEMSRLDGEIRHTEQERSAVAHEEETLKRQEAEAKQTLEHTVQVRGREKTDALDVARTTKQLQEELTQLTQKKETLIVALAKIRHESANQQHAASQVLPHTTTHAAQEAELHRQLHTLEIDIEKLKKDIATDEARLAAEKATFAREEAELKSVQQKLVQATSAQGDTTAKAHVSVIKEQKMRQDEEQTKTLLGRIERSIQGVMKKIQEVTSRGQVQKQTAQKESREELTARQAIHTDRQKLLDRDRRLKQFDTDLRTKKEKKAKLEAEIKTLK